MIDEDEVMDIDELSAAILAVGKKQTREIKALRKQVMGLKREAKAWCMRAGMAEGLTEAAIKAAMDDIEGIR